MMSASEFIKFYEAALRSQDWAKVAPLINEDARVVFSNGVLLDGKAAIQAAYEHNFSTIQNENFQILNVHWVLNGQDSAAYMFDFTWTGLIDGRKASGSGRGTTVLQRRGDGWVLVAEQLGPKS